MNLRTRRIAAVAAVAMAAMSALAAANHAQARFTATSYETSSSGLTQTAHDPFKAAYTSDCKIKPRWTQNWNNELNRFTWKKIWVKRCGTTTH